MERVHLVALHPLAALCGASTVNETTQTELIFLEYKCVFLWGILCVLLSVVAQQYLQHDQHDRCKCHIHNSPDYTIL